MTAARRLAAIRAAARRLAAIRAADAAGCSRLAGAEEAGTAKAAPGRREAARPTTFSANEASSPRRIEPFLRVAFLPLPVDPAPQDHRYGPCRRHWFEFVRD